MSQVEGCPFCRIVQDDPEGQVELEVGSSIVITPLNPVTEGHKLVIPFAHVADLAENPRVTGSVMEDAARYIAKEGVGPCNVITSRGEEATQTVLHMHVHVVPRRHGDRLALPWDSPRNPRRVEGGVPPRSPRRP